LGGIKVIHIKKYEQLGDMFGGCSLSMMPLLQPQFGAAPPSFKHGDGGLTAAHIQTITEAIYPALNNTGLCGVVTQPVCTILYYFPSRRSQALATSGAQWTNHLPTFPVSRFACTEVTPVVCVQYPWDQGTDDDRHHPPRKRLSGETVGSFTTTTSGETRCRVVKIALVSPKVATWPAYGRY
jgi:hypothetical protein